MEFIKKLLPLLVIAVVFAIVGYFIAKGFTNNQQAAFYNATANMNTIKAGSTIDPCTMNPTIPCTPTGAEINITCPQGTTNIKGKCVPNSGNTTWTVDEAKAWCASRNLQYNPATNGCIKGTIAPVSGSTKAY